MVASEGLNKALCIEALYKGDDGANGRGLYHFPLPLSHPVPVTFESPGGLVIGISKI